MALCIEDQLKDTELIDLINANNYEWILYREKSRLKPNPNEVSRFLPSSCGHPEWELILTNKIQESYIVPIRLFGWEGETVGYELEVPEDCLKKDLIEFYDRKKQKKSLIELLNFK